MNLSIKRKIFQAEASVNNAIKGLQMFKTLRTNSRSNPIRSHFC